MPFLDKIRTFLGLGRPCPRCGEGLACHRMFTVPVDERLFLVSRLLMLGRVKEEAARAEAESILAARMSLPKDVASGVRTSFCHCAGCKYGQIDAELIEGGKVREARSHAASGPAYDVLSRLMGGA